MSDIPEGRVNKMYGTLKILSNIQAKNIKITPATYSHVSNIFIRRLHSYEYDIPEDPSLPLKIVNAIRDAVPKGLVLTNWPSEDPNRPNDRQLEIYTYINLENIHPDLVGTAKLRVFCRLYMDTGALAIRTIQRNFKVG